jgi:hypothetical protein
MGESTLISQLALSVFSILSLMTIGNAIIRIILKRELGGTLEVLALSFFVGSSLLICISTVVGVVIQHGLQLFFYTFFFVGLVLLLYRLTCWLRTLFRKGIDMLWLERLGRKLPILILLFSLAIIPVHASLTAVHPVDDAAEAFLPMARLMCESDGIPEKTPIWLFSGYVISVPPGVSELYAYVFTITHSFSSTVLAFLEVSFILGLSALAYVMSKKCGLNEIWASLSAILTLGLPYWIFYFKIIPRYADLGAAFMASTCIYLTLVLLRHQLSAPKLIVLSLGLSAATLSKFQCLIVPLIVVIITLKMSKLWSRQKILLSTIILGAYLAVGILGSSMLYVPATMFGGNILVALYVFASVPLVVMLLRLEFRQCGKITSKVFIGLFVVSLIPAVWYARTWYLTGSPLSPVIKLGDAVWAGHLLAEAKAGSVAAQVFLFSKPFVDRFKSAPIALTIPFLVGLSRIHKSRSLFRKGVEAWLLVGLATFIGIFFLEDVRYMLYFMLPLVVIACVGVSYIIGKYAKNPTYSMIALFLISLTSISLLIEGINQIMIPLLLLLTSTPIWVVLAMRSRFINITSRLKTLFESLELSTKVKKSLIVMVFILTISVAWIGVIVECRSVSSGEPFFQLYRHIKEVDEREGSLITFSSLGIYYYTGIDTINIAYPEGLELFKPLIDAPDIQSGAKFLIQELRVKGAVLPIETNTFWYSWYHTLLGELPELRILHNPQMFNVVYHTEPTSGWSGWYFLSKVNESCRPYGILDLVVKKEGGVVQEASLLLPCNYGKKQIYIADSCKNLSLLTFLYFPRWLSGEAIFNVETYLTIIENRAHDQIVRNETLYKQEPLNISKIVEVEIGKLMEEAEVESASISINKIQLDILGESFKIHITIVPASDDGTWIIYSSVNEVLLWTHMGSNLMEVNASLTDKS